MEINPIKNDARRATRESRLGKDARCALCDTGNLETLIPVKASLIENHHTVGRANDRDLQIPLCRNCHAAATERLKHAGVSMNPPMTALHKIVEVLKAWSAFFTQLAEKCCELASELARLITGLDKQHPTWIEMPEAQL